MSFHARGARVKEGRLSMEAARSLFVSGLVLGCTLIACAAGPLSACAFAPATLIADSSLDASVHVFEEAGPGAASSEGLLRLGLSVVSSVAIDTVHWTVTRGGTGYLQQ